jgi:tetratricopeptide (TPR) repeat protein
VQELNRALRAKHKGRTDEAIQHLDEAARLDPSFWEAHANLADLYWRKQEPAAALEHLEVALEIDPNSGSLQSNRAVALLALGRPGEAESAARRALQLEPLSGEAHFNLSIALLRQGRSDREIADHLAIAARRCQQAKETYDLFLQSFAGAGCRP